MSLDVYSRLIVGVKTNRKDDNLFIENTTIAIDEDTLFFEERYQAPQHSYALEIYDKETGEEFYGVLISDYEPLSDESDQISMDDLDAWRKDVSELLLDRYEYDGPIFLFSYGLVA
jgi:hypothetical protein